MKYESVKVLLFIEQEKNKVKKKNENQECNLILVTIEEKHTKVKN